MTDEDIVRRVALLLDRAVVPLKKRQRHHRQPYATTIKGAAAVALMRALQPWLGTRRRAQITDALNDAADRPLRWRRPMGICSAPACARPSAIRGLCRHHYKLWWKAQRRGNVPRYLPLDPSLTSDVIGHDLASCDDECQISWLAGLLEGEGCFGLTQERGHRAYPTITLQMCDEDVVARVAVILGAHGVTRSERRRPSWSPTFTANISGAAAADWMSRLYPLMGMRRRAAIDKALAAYAPIRLVHPSPTCVVHGCHAPHRSRGLCHKHYMSWMRDVAKGRTPRVTPLRD